MCELYVKLIKVVTVVSGKLFWNGVGISGCQLLQSRFVSLVVTDGLLDSLTGS